MTSESDSLSWPWYVDQTRQRMARAIGELAAIQQAGGGDLGRVMARLRDQRAASRTAGLGPISQLCQAFEDCLVLEGCLTAAHAAHRPRSTTFAATLLDACRFIQLHADAVAKTAAYLNTHDDCPSLCACLRRLLPSDSLASNGFPAV